MILDYCRFLDATQFETIVLVISEAVPERLAEFSENNIPVIEVNFKLDRIFQTISKVRSIYEAIEKEEPDIIHTHMERAEFFGFFVKDVPRIHTHHYFSRLVDSKGITDKIRRYIHKFMSVRYDRYIMVSEALTSFYKNEQRLTETQTMTIYNGVNIEALQKGHSKIYFDFIDPDDFVIGFVGRLSPEKGCDILLKAVSKINDSCPSFHTLIVGEGPERSRLDRLVNDCNLAAKVHFLGFRKDVPSIYQTINVLVMPSHTEGLPMAAIEALSCGVPVVGSRVGGLPEIVKDGYTGFLFDRGDVDALTQILIKCIKKHGDLKLLSTDCQRHAMQNFDSKRIIPVIEKLYKKLVASH